MRCCAAVVVLMAASMAWGAAPPGKVRNLTNEEAKHLEAPLKRLDELAASGEFEKAAQVARQIADFRRRHQGARHEQAIDARFHAEDWKRLASVPAKHRAGVVRARQLQAEGRALQNRERFREAEKPLRQALALFHATLGEKHPETAICYNSLAMCIEDLGTPADALPLYEKALAIRRETLGKEHPYTALSANNLAFCLNTAGRSADALPLFREALAVRLSVLGQAHRRTLESYNNVASCLTGLGRSVEAFPLLRTVLDTRLDLLGETHSDTAISYNNLAFALNSQGKESEALPLYRKSLEITIQLSGESASTAVSYNNVASTLDAIGKSLEALPLHQKALAIFFEVLGEKHPNTAQSYNNVASCLRGLGKPAEALPLSRKALAIFLESLGEHHPITATGYNNVAVCLEALGKPAEALPLYRKALEINQKRLGETHPATAVNSNNVAYCLVALGKSSEALPLFRKALDIHRKTLGENHPRTATSVNNVAVQLEAQGAVAQAARLLQQSLAGQEAARFHQTSESGFDRALAQSANFSPHAGLARFLARLKQPRNAFAHAEASLARGLLDDLDARGNPDVDRLRRLQAQLKTFDAPLIAFARLTRPTEEQRTRHETVARQQRAVLSEINQLIAEDSARRVLPLERIQKSIPADAALALWLDVEMRWACVVRREGVPAWIHLPGSGKAASATNEDKALARRLHEALTDPDTSEAELRRRTGDYSKQFLDPVRPHLKGVKRLFVVPSGPLGRVPLEAITSDFTVSYVPSGSVLALTMEHHRSLDTSSLLAIGDPLFDRTPPADPPRSGVLVLTVLPKTHAARAGLQPGDVVLSIGGKKLESFDDLKAALPSLPANASFWRDGKEANVRLQGSPLGAVFDGRSAEAAVRAWRRDQEMLVQRGTGHKRLPGTRLEVEAISAMVKGSNSLLGSDASEQQLDTLIGSGKLKRARLIHLATHGEPDEQRPGRSALILAQDKLPDPLSQVKAQKHPYDGRLTVSRIRERWQLDADLVVLSACESGLGKEARGDGLLGFAQAFLSRGARSVVLSRWKVDDTATSLLMIRLYENLLGKRKGVKPMGRAASLEEAKKWLRTLPRKEAERLATLHTGGVLRGSEGVEKPSGKVKQIEYKGDTPFAHPYYWAAFTLIGDPD